MVDITQGIEAGKMQLDALRIQMEMEHYQLAEMVQLELEEQGYNCEIKEDGYQRFSGVKVKRWIIEQVGDDQKNHYQFTKDKDKITKKLAKVRMKELKTIKKQEKRKSKEQGFVPPVLQK